MPSAGWKILFRTPRKAETAKLSTITGFEDGCCSAGLAQVPRRAETMYSMSEGFPVPYPFHPAQSFAIHRDRGCSRLTAAQIFGLPSRTPCKARVI